MWRRQSTTTSWVFRYTLIAADRDDDGVSLERNPLRGYAGRGPVYSAASAATGRVMSTRRRS